MDDLEEIDENISLGLKSFDQVINYSIIVKKYFTCSQLIFYINQVIREKFKGFGDITDLIYLCNGSILPFSSATLESSNIKDGDIIMLMKSESEGDDNKNLIIKKKAGSIKITAFSREENIVLPITFLISDFQRKSQSTLSQTPQGRCLARLFYLSVLL